MKISIRWVVIIGCFVLVWGTHLIIAPFSFFTTQKVMLDHTRDIMENILELSLKETQNFFSIARGAAHLTKRLISSDVVNADRDNLGKLEQYFFDQLQIYPQFAGIYFADPRGNFYYVSRVGTGVGTDGAEERFRTKVIRHGQAGRTVSMVWRDRDMRTVRRAEDPEDRYDPRIRPWYVKAIEKQGIIWTDPYLFFTSQKPGITTAGPVYDEAGNLSGVVGVDIELDVLSRFIGSLRVGKTGIAFIVDQTEDVIAYPDLDQLKIKGGDGNGKVRLSKVSELKNPICYQAYQAAAGAGVSETDGPAFARFVWEDKTFYTMFTSVAESEISWTIGVYIPEADYLGQINANRQLTLLLTLLVSVMATIAGLMVAGRIIRPITQLDRDAQNIRNNVYADLPRIRTIFQQIQHTADSFHQMKQAVINYKKELRKKEKIHRTITETANEAIFVTESGGKVIYWNRAAEDLFGYGADQVLDQSVFELTPFRPRRDSEDLTLFSLFKIRDNISILKNAEMTIRSGRGSSVPVELSMVRIRVDGIPYIIAVVRDISLRKETEQEKLAIWRQLQQAQKMEAIGTLAGGIAHDFNNILTAIIGSAELLRASLDTGDDTRTEHLDAIDLAGDRARDLVRQILTFSIQDAHEQKILDLASIVSEACHLMASSLPASVTLVREIEFNCSPILGDATQIHQVALNLMTNAFQAMESKGGTLTVSLSETELAEGGGADDPELGPGRYLCYTVSDTGVGIDETLMDKIFDPYFTTKEKGRGTGLGLAVIQGIVQRHGGGIRVESEPGNGTVFHIFLPVADRVPEPVGKGRHTMVLKGSEHILLVDDQKQVLVVERQILELLGYRVTARSTPEEALETFGDSPDEFDMVITDYSMPNMDGAELARKMKALRRDIPIIICSGYNQGIPRAELRTEGIREFVTKPVKVKEFSVTVRNVLDGK